MKEIKSALQFIFYVILVLLCLEVTHSAASPEYRSRMIVHWQLKHPVLMARLIAHDDTAWEDAFLDDPIRTTQFVIASMLN